MIRDDEIQRALDDLNVEIDATAKAGTKVLSEEMQKVVNDAADEYRREFTALDEATWEAVYRPALLARIYTHLSDELKKSAQGWEDVFFQTIRHRYEEEQ